MISPIASIGLNLEIGKKGGLAFTCPGADIFFPTFNQPKYTKTQVGKGEFDDGLTFVRFIYELN